MEWVPVGSYLLILGFFTLIGAPIAAFLCHHLPRGGAAFALPAALVPFTIVVFWLGQVTFGRHTLFLAGSVVLAISGATYRAGYVPAWRAVARMYGVFVGGFLIMLGFRALDPGITPIGGEQFLHFGLVNALERAESLPPTDMWFAGEPLQYYYGTQLQVTSLALLAGTPLRYGFNLGIATFYGVLFVVAYGVSGAIAARRGCSHSLGGILGAFFVALAGPTTTPLRLLSPYLPAPVDQPLEQAAFGFVAERYYGGDLLQATSELSNPFEWSWWFTRYVVPGTLQEVPLYSFVKADLHGHTFATGYVLFAGALAFAYYATPAGRRRQRSVLIFGGLGATAGLFGFMNTWSLPTAAGLAVLAVAAADSHPATVFPDAVAQRLQLTNLLGGWESVPRVVKEGWRLCLAAVVGGLVSLIGVALAAPFLVFGHVPTNEGIGVLPPQSSLGPFLVIYAGLLTVFVLGLVIDGRRAATAFPNRWLAVGGLGAAVAVVFVAVRTEFAVLAVLTPLIGIAWLIVRSDQGGFVLVLLVAGVGLVLSLELVHARLPLIEPPRWNTSLKVAVQGWTLGAAGAGAVLAATLSRCYGKLRGVSPSAGGHDANADVEGSANDAPTDARTFPAGISAQAGSLFTIGVVGLVLTSAAVFPAMVVGFEVGGAVTDEPFEPSIDAMDSIEANHANEAGALMWLTERPGRPVIAEAPGRSYTWTSPAATVSGLPGVIGWAHQEEYRSPEAYDRRVDDVDTMYTGRWRDAAAVLHRYNVTYVYVGPNERSRYGAQLRSFDRAAFSPAFTGDAVTIYEVNRSAVAAVTENRATTSAGHAK